HRDILSFPTRRSSDLMKPFVMCIGLTPNAYQAVVKVPERSIVSTAGENVNLPSMAIGKRRGGPRTGLPLTRTPLGADRTVHYGRSEEHTSELQSPDHL